MGIFYVQFLFHDEQHKKLTILKLFTLENLYVVLSSAILLFIMLLA